MGKGSKVTTDFNWEGLDIEACDDLGNLADPFSEEEVWDVIKEIPSDRAPSPDGFIAIFYHKAWLVNKHDIMAALFNLYVGDDRGFSNLIPVVGFYTPVPRRKNQNLLALKPCEAASG